MSEFYNGIKKCCEDNKLTKIDCSDCKAVCCRYYAGCVVSKKEMKYMKTKKRGLIFKKFDKQNMELMYEDQRCAFLDNKFRCEIYDMRPRTCAKK